MTVFNKFSCWWSYKIQKKIFADNNFHNILRLFDDFSFTISEMMQDYYFKHGRNELHLELLNDLRLKILGNKKILGKYLNLPKVGKIQIL